MNRIRAQYQPCQLVAQVVRSHYHILLYALQPTHTVLFPAIVFHLEHLLKHSALFQNALMLQCGENTNSVMKHVQVLTFCGFNHFI